MSLTVRVITPDKTVWDDTAEEIILPSLTGQLGILPNHAPLLTALGVGVMRIRPAKEWKTIALMGGFAEVENNQVKILVNGAQMGESIDPEVATQELESAETAMASAEKSGDRLKIMEATQALKKAKVRHQAATGLIKA